MEDTMLLIPKSLAQAILNYLAERPWKEVYQAQQQLMALEKAPQPTGSLKDVPELKAVEQEQA
jgi:hypothetical protein